MRKIEAIHNKYGWEDFNDFDFNLAEPLLIKSIEALIRDGIFPQIGTSICPAVTDDEGSNDYGDCYVYYITGIWFYDEHISFVFDEDKDAKVN